MLRNASFAMALLVLLARTPAQQFPPGDVNPRPILAAASKEIGEGTLRCITFSGSGYGGAVGQTFENAVNIDWPRIDALANYTRSINWEAGASKETFDRKPGMNSSCIPLPSSGDVCSGCRGSSPLRSGVHNTSPAGVSAEK
jgi:hypothetical protein